jgi:hypothetical protein
MIRLHNRESIKLLRSIYSQIYKWCKNYSLITSGETFILVAHPDDVICVAIVDKTAVDMDTVKRIITAKTIQRGARYMLVLGNSLRISDVNCARCSMTRALFASPD